MQKRRCSYERASGFSVEQYCSFLRMWTFRFEYIPREKDIRESEPLFSEETTKGADHEQCEGYCQRLCVCK